VLFGKGFGVAIGGLSQDVVGGSLGAQGVCFPTLCEPRGCFQSLLPIIEQLSLGNSSLSVIGDLRGRRLLVVLAGNRL